MKIRKRGRIIKLHSFIYSFIQLTNECLFCVRQCARLYESTASKNKKDKIFVMGELVV